MIKVDKFIRLEIPAIPPLPVQTVDLTIDEAEELQRNLRSALEHWRPCLTQPFQPHTPQFQPPYVVHAGPPAVPVDIKEPDWPSDVPSFELSKPEPTEGGALDVPVKELVQESDERKPKTPKPPRETDEDMIVRQWHKFTALGVQPEKIPTKIGSHLSGCGRKVGINDIRAILERHGLKYTTEIKYPLNTVQVHKEPETVVPSNTHQIDFAAFRPVPIKGIDPLVSAQVIKYHFVGQQPLGELLHLNGFLKLPLLEEFASQFPQGYGAWLRELPPFKRNDHLQVMSLHFKGQVAA